MFYLHPDQRQFQHDANEIYAINANGSGLTLVIDGPTYKFVTEWWD